MLRIHGALIHGIDPLRRSLICCACNTAQEMRPEVLAANHIQQAIALHNALESGNYGGFFQLVRRLPYLMACLAHRFFPAVWEHALGTLAESAPFTANHTLSLIALQM